MIKHFIFDYHSFSLYKRSAYYYPPSVVSCLRKQASMYLLLIKKAVDLLTFLLTQKREVTGKEANTKTRGDRGGMLTQKREVTGNREQAG